MNQRQRVSRSITERSMTTNDHSRTDKEKLSHLFLAIVKIAKRKKYFGFLRFIANTNKHLYRDRILLSLHRLFINKNRVKKIYGI